MTVRLLLLLATILPWQVMQASNEVLNLLSTRPKTSTEQARVGHTLFNNKLPLHGVKTLFKVKNPNSISDEVKNLWKAALPANHPIWQQVQVKWSQAWTNFFDQETQVRANLPQMGPGQLRAMLGSTQHPAARAALEFQLALDLASAEKTTQALAILDRLLKARDHREDKNLMALTAGRLLYPRGDWGKAIQYYRQVTQESEYWFTAQEEMAWSYMAKGEPQNSLAITNGLILDTFAAHVGPDALFLHAFSQLKTCNFFGTANSLNVFKQRFKQRAQSLMKVRREGWTPEVTTLFQTFKQGKRELLSLGPAALQVPRYVSRDRVLWNQIQTQAALDREVAQIQTLLGQAMGSPGMVKKLKNIQISLQSRNKRLKKASVALIKQRASEEIAEIKQVLQRMHILEAEWIQRVATIVQPEKVRVASADKLATGEYDLKFPFTGEIWFDELNNYRVSSSEVCQK